MAQPKWQRRADHRPREICAAALGIFAEKGFASAKLDEIARRAGVSKGTLYLYFSDKEELFRAVVRSAVVPNMEALTASIAATNLPIAEVVGKFLAQFADNAERLPIGAVVKMVIGESRNFPELARVWHDEVVSKAIDAISALVAGAQRRGEVRPGDPRLQAMSLIGPMIMGALWQQTLVPAGGRPIDLAELARQHGDVVLRGLLVERGS